MLRLILVFLFFAAAIPSFGTEEALVCTGDVTVSNFGSTTTDEARLEFDHAGSAYYTGPHASNVLGTVVYLDLGEKNAHGWRLADLSSSGPNSETNEFWIRELEANQILFYYKAHFGYNVTGTLSCL